MKWAKRALWTAAWGGWVCLGVSLCPELPREPGSPVGKKLLAAGEFVETPDSPMMFDMAFREGSKDFYWFSCWNMVDVDAHQFLVREKWDELWKEWVPFFKYRTYAWRSLEDGSLEYRTNSSFTVLPGNMSADRQYFVLRNGSLYRFPPPVNYSLLALCQTILAMPLILLWSVLQWRRNRGMRLTSAAETAR